MCVQKGAVVIFLYVASSTGVNDVETQPIKRSSVSTCVINLVNSSIWFDNLVEHIPNL